MPIDIGIFERKKALIIELLLFLMLLSSVAYTLWYLFDKGYLPVPFYYGSASLFTDWTASAFYANNAGEYTSFNSVYPPLSFVFLRFFSIHGCYEYNDIFSSRDCDWVMPATLVMFFIINLCVAYRAYAVLDKPTALMRAIAVGFGLPSLAALERGNLIIPCFTFFMLGNSRFFKSAILKWVSSAIAINFKPYLIMSLVGPLFRRRWRWFEGCGVAGLAVYLVTYALNGDGNPIQVLRDISGFNTTDAKGIFERAIYASGYKPINDLIASNFPLMSFTGSRPIEVLKWLLPLGMDLGKLGTVISFVLAIWKRGSIPIFRLSALGIGWVLISQDPGGYAVIFFFFLVFMERWKGAFCIFALVVTYLMSFSVDMVVVRVAHEQLYSYLTQRVVGYDLGVTAGELLRPGLLLLVEYALIAQSCIDAFTVGALRDGNVLERPSVVAG